MRGTYVRGITSEDQVRLDLFEGVQYDRVRLPVNLVDDKGDLGEEKEADTYVWAEDESDLDAGEWDFEEFKREKMRRWVGSDEEYEGELFSSVAGLGHTQWLRALLISK